MLDLIVMAYLFGALGFMGLARAKWDIPPDDRRAVLALILLWPAVVALVVIAFALLVIGVVLYGVSEL